MDIEKAKGIIDGYASWWRDGVSIYQEGASVRLVCPMLDRNNDHMSIYMGDDPSNKGAFILTDLGATISDLDISGCDILGSKSRTEKLEKTLRSLGLKHAGAEVYTRADASNLYQRMNMLMQGMASIDNLFFTARDSVRGYFMDDVAYWLNEHDIRYMESPIFEGLSGFQTMFDFAIPRARDIAPERLIKTIGNPTTSNVKNAIFGWSDIKVSRGDSQLFIFINDESREVSPEIKIACEQYDTTPVPWSEAEKYALQLAA